MPDVETNELTYDEIISLLQYGDITVDEARRLVNPAEKERLETLLKYLQPAHPATTGVQQPPDKNVDDWGYRIGEVIQEGEIDGRPARLIYEGSGYGRLYVYQEAFGDIPAGYYPQPGASARPIEKRVPKAADTYNRLPKEEVPEGWTNIGGNFYRAAPEKGEATGAVYLAQVNETTGRWFWQKIKDAIKAPKAGYYETPQEALAANPAAGEEDLKHDDNGYYILPKKAEVPTKWPAGYKPGDIVKEPVSGVYGQYIDDGTGTGNIRFVATTQPTQPTAPTTPPVRGNGKAPDNQPLGDIRKRPDGSTYYYILDANNNAVVADVTPATDLTPLQRAQKQDADAKWVMDRAFANAQAAEALRSQRAQAAETRGWEMSQASLADVRQRERDAATMAWNQQQARATQEQEATRVAEDKRRYGASLQANPLSWVESNVYNQTTPAVQPWMIPLSEGRYSMADVGKSVYPAPELPESMFTMNEGQLSEISPGLQERMTPEQSNIIRAQRIAGMGGEGINPALKATATSAPLTSRELMDLSVWQQDLRGSQALPALSTPSAQAWARMGPTERAMYGSYEKARTGIPYEDLKNRLWATTTPGQGGGGVRRRY